MLVFATLTVPGTDEAERRGKNLIGVQVAGIQLIGVFGRLQRRDGAVSVARVAFLHIRENAAMYSVEAPFPQLFKTPFGADLDAGGDEQLGVGVGADHGADVAAIENRPFGAAGGVGGEIALKFK